MEVGAQFHALATLLPQELSQVPITLKCGWAPESLSTWWRGQTFLTVPGIEPAHNLD
jgi:hypothetical protein